MNVRALVLSLGLLLAANSLLAQFQTRRTINELYQVDEHIKRQTSGDRFSNPDQYKGTPYHNPDYQEGNVYKGDELMAYKIALRYNAVADEMEIKESLLSKDEDARSLTKDPDIYVKIKDDIFVFVPLNGSIEEGGYFQILFEGKKVDLYKKIIKEFQPGRKASSSLTKDILPIFKDESLYFVVAKNGRFYQLPESRVNKLDIFGGDKANLEAYASQRELDLQEEADLLEVIKYYDKS